MKKDLKLLLEKYQQGSLTVKEELSLADMLADSTNSEADHLLKEDLLNHLDSDASDKKELTNVLNRIHHQIHLKQSENNKKKVRQLYLMASKAAAILFIPLVLISLYLGLHNPGSAVETSLVELVAPPGARINFQLPDETSGILNGGSTISYASSFTGKRHVELKGEAYFDVAKDKQHPFTIAANDNEVQVVGTKFSLSAYPEDLQTELVLEEGKVLFKSPLAEKQIEITPGRRLVVKDGQIRQSEVATWKYTAWKDGKLVFRNDSMQELAQRISHWYNVDVEVRDSSLDQYTFRGVFEDDSLEEVLRLLKMTSSLDYKIIDRQLNDDGSFSRKTVILTKK